MRKFSFTLLFFNSLLFFTVSFVYADIYSKYSRGGMCTNPPTAGPTSALLHDHVETAIGCVPTEPAALASDIVGLAIGIGGAVAFLFLVSGAFKLISSGGDPDNIQAAKERITSALAGLLLIVFSVVILQIIGIQVLGLPGFGGTGTRTISVPGP